MQVKHAVSGFQDLLEHFHTFGVCNNEFDGIITVWSQERFQQVVDAVQVHVRFDQNLLIIFSPPLCHPECWVEYVVHLYLT